MPTGTPTYLRINPDGTVTASFTGHVEAQGLDLVAGQIDSPPNIDRVVWHLDSMSGAMVASIYAYATDPTNSTIKMEAQSTIDTSINGSIWATVNPFVSSILGQVSAVGKVKDFTIMDSDQNSTFLQNIDNEQWRFTIGQSSPSLSIGWNTVNIPYFLNPAPTQIFGFYTVQTPVGASIDSHHMMSVDSSGMNVAVSSTVAQSVTMFGLAFGRN